MAKLYFRYGAMGSSKTANAVMVAFNYTTYIRLSNGAIAELRLKEAE